MPVECERLQGFPDEWTLPDGHYGDAERVETLRYTAIGNAVTVPVAEWLARRIKAYLISSRDSALLGTEDVVCEPADAGVSCQGLDRRIEAAHLG